VHIFPFAPVIKLTAVVYKSSDHESKKEFVHCYIRNEYIFLRRL
jgi:hypothetical protein